MAKDKSGARKAVARSRSALKVGTASKTKTRKGAAGRQIKYRGVTLELAKSPRKPKLTIDGESVAVTYSKGDKAYVSPLQPYASAKDLEDLSKEILDNAERYRERGN